jgi:hypothetical protein
MKTRASARKRQRENDRLEARRLERLEPPPPVERPDRRPDVDDPKHEEREA